MFTFSFSCEVLFLVETISSNGINDGFDFISLLLLTLLLFAVTLLLLCDDDDDADDNDNDDDDHDDDDDSGRFGGNSDSENTLDVNDDNIFFLASLVGTDSTDTDDIIDVLSFASLGVAGMIPIAVSIGDDRKIVDNDNDFTDFGDDGNVLGITIFFGFSSGTCGGTCG